MSDALIGAIFGGIAALIAAGIPAWIALSKARQELKKKERADVLDEWKQVTDMQGERISAMEKEITGQREQIRGLYIENAQLRALMAAKDTRIEKQAGQVEKLQTAVTIMKQPEGVAQGVLDTAEKAASALLEKAKETAGHVSRDDVATIALEIAQTAAAAGSQVARDVLDAAEKVAEGKAKES